MSRRSFTTEAVVLASTDVGEEDRILTFLTPDHGLVRAAASSARNLRKGRTAPLDLFARTVLSVNQPRKEGMLRRVGSARIVDPFMGIRADYARLCAASYMCQTLAHCIQEEDPSSGSYRLLLSCLKGLDQGEGPFRVILAFEIRFLFEMGLMPELGHCLACAEPVRGDVLIQTVDGGVVHRGCTAVETSGCLTGGDLAVLRYISSREPDAVSKLTIREEDARRVFKELHRFSVHHLGYESRALTMLEGS